MNEFFRIIGGVAELTASKAERIYNSLIITLLGTVGLVVIMWAINAYGAKEINFIFFFLGGILLLIMGFTPRVVGISAVAGLAVNGLQDKDLSQGTVSGMKALYKVVTGILFGFWIVAGLLATWSFKEAPMAFWLVATMAMVIGVAIEFYEIKGGVFKWVVIIYAIGVILAAFWQTFPQEWKPSRNADTPPATASTQVAKHEARWERQADGSISVGVWQPWTRVPSDSCVKIRDVRPEQVQLKDNEHDEGIDWTTYHKNGKRTFDYFRLKSDGRSTVVKYEFRPWGTCS